MPPFGESHNQARRPDNLHHHSQSLPGLVGSVLVDEVMHVSTRRACDEDVEQVQEVHQYGHVELLQLPLVVDFTAQGVEPLDAGR